MTATKPRKKKSESVVLTDWDMADYIKTKKDVIAFKKCVLNFLNNLLVLTEVK